MERRYLACILYFILRMYSLTPKNFQPNQDLPPAALESRRRGEDKKIYSQRIKRILRIEDESFFEGIIPIIN